MDPPAVERDAESEGMVRSTELVVPEGFEALQVRLNGGGRARAGKAHWWRVQFAGQYIRGFANGDYCTWVGQYKDIDRKVGTIPIVLDHKNYLSLAATLQVRCVPTLEHMQAWQLETYEAIMNGYLAARAAYDDQVRQANASYEALAGSRNPSANEMIVRDELKRAVISTMTAQRFDLFDAMRPAGSVHPVPEIAFADAAAEGRYVAFCEQAFEWENMTFVLYPYFWGRKPQWPELIPIEDVDPLFASSLKAGFARVQLPVRPRFEESVRTTFSPDNWSGNEWIGEELPGFESDPVLPIEEELRAQTGGGTFVQGLGSVTLTKDSDLVVGQGTAFSDDDLDRELRTSGTDYRIVGVVDATTVRITPVYAGDTAANVQYAVGAKLIGLPWEVVVPTTLVYLQDDSRLNVEMECPESF